MSLGVFRIKVLAFFLLLSLLFFACTKITTSDIGAGLLPSADGVVTKDTVLDVISKNTGFDSVYVGISDDHALGYINDPIFGTTTAAINFQVSAPYYPLSFGADKDRLYLDSVVLSLSYRGVYGDTIPHVAFRVYQIEGEESFFADSFYNNTVSFEKGELLNEFGAPKEVDITTLNDPDTLPTYSEIATRTIRIRLTQAFGEKLLKQFDSTNAYQDDSTFHAYLRGFVVQPEQTGNALLLVNLLDTSTRLSLYYRFIDSLDHFDTAVRRFSPSVYTSASSNMITRNYQGTQVPLYFPPNPDPQDSLIFIQTSPGTYATLQVPGLSGLPNVIVHRAEFLMEQVPDETSLSDNYFKAPNLFLTTYSQDSMRRFGIPFEFNFSTSGITNLASFSVLPIPKIDKVTGRTISSYNFEITRYVQSIVTTHNTVHNFVLWAPYNYYIYPLETSPYTIPLSTPALNPVSVGRVRLGGGNNTQHKMRLHIVYSLL